VKPVNNQPSVAFNGSFSFEIIAHSKTARSGIPKD
jgi:hypothetical protein